MHGEALRLKGEPIPHLYHAGDVRRFMAITSQETCGAIAAVMIAVCELAARDPCSIGGEVRP